MSGGLGIAAAIAGLGAYRWSHGHRHLKAIYASLPGGARDIPRILEGIQASRSWVQGRITDAWCFERRFQTPAIRATVWPATVDPATWQRTPTGCIELDHTPFYKDGKAVVANLVSVTLNPANPSIGDVLVTGLELLYNPSRNPIKTGRVPAAFLPPYAERFVGFPLVWVAAQYPEATTQLGRPVDLPFPEESPSGGIQWKSFYLLPRSVVTGRGLAENAVEEGARTLLADLKEWATHEPEIAAARAERREGFLLAAFGVAAGAAALFI